MRSATQIWLLGLLAHGALGTPMMGSPGTNCGCTPTTGAPDAAAQGQGIPTMPLIESGSSMNPVAMGTAALTGTPQVTSIPPASNACDTVRSMQAETLLEDPSAVLTVPVSVATACLNSIPVDKDLSVQHINEVKKMLQFYTGIGQLKNLPEGVNKEQYPANIDLDSMLDAIAEDMQNGKITSHFDFERRIANVLASTHDGHTFLLGGTTTIFQFGAPFDLISLSEDGKKPPKVFTTDPEGRGKVDPVAVSQIDGVDVVDYLRNMTELIQQQGLDARYNNAFQKVPVLNKQHGSFSVFQGGIQVPPKDTFDVTYENGTTATYSFEARVTVPFVVTSGDEALEVAKNPNFGATTVQAPSSTDSPGSGGFPNMPMARLYRRPSAPDWSEIYHNKIKEDRVSLLKRPGIHSRAGVAPEVGLVSPVAQDLAGTFAGFLLPDSSTAVARISSFDSIEEAVDTTQSYRDFFDQCRQNNMTNLIIDVRSNNGGRINLGYDFFRNMFPDDQNPFQAQRARAHEGSRIFAEALASPNATLATALQLNASSSTDANAAQALDDLVNLAMSHLSFQEGLLSNTTTLKAFPNFESFFGPFNVGGDNFTAPFAFNWTAEVSAGFTQAVVDVDSNPPDPKSQPPFKEGNIVFVTDGICASTCSNLAEFLHSKPGVRSVAVGGLPRLEGMALVGGVRGSQIINQSFLEVIAISLNNISPPQNEAEAKRRAEILPGEFPFNVEDANAGVNFLDNFRDVDGLPLQFLKEDADCKLFFTKDTAFDSLKLYSQIGSLAFPEGAGEYTGMDGCAVGTLHNVRRN